MQDNSNQDEADRLAAEAAAKAAADANNWNPHENWGTPPDDNKGDDLAAQLRREQQKYGSTTEQFRHAFVTALKEDPAKALEMVEKIDPRVAERVIADLWLKDKEEFSQKFKPTTPPATVNRDEIANIVKEVTQQTQMESVKASIVAELDKLPDSIRDVTKREFETLTAGRQLNAEEMKVMAKKALFIAQGETGWIAKVAQMNYWSLNLWGTATPTGGEPDAVDNILLEQGKTDDFWLLGVKQKSNK